MEQLSRKEADKLANTITGDHGIGTADYFAETVDAYWYKNNYGLEGAIGMSII
jgi:hypothetical protein